MRVAYLTNSAPHSGVGYRAQALETRLRKNGVVVEEIKVGRSVASLPKSAGWVLSGWEIRRQLEDFDIVEATNQTLSFMGGAGKPFVVTVHDIIEMLEPQVGFAGRLVNRYLYSGIRKADHIIAVSEYTATTVREYYGMPAERITVIPNGVGPEFHSIPNFQHSVGHHRLRQELKLAPENQVALYVGSDHPRKNVVGAVRIFAKFRETFPQAIFVKVGEAGIAAGRTQLLEKIKGLGIGEQVRFVGNVSLEKLNELYNLADVLLYPSRFEGFGLPPLQAMAAGTPVVTSNATSIPEVVGQAASMHAPDDIDGMAESVQKVLTDARFADSLRAKGFERAKQFVWEKSAAKVLEVYKSVL